MDNNSLEKIRKEIDVLDRELAVLLQKRMDLVSQVADYKSKTKINILDSSREAQVIENVLNVIKKTEYHESISSVFEYIMTKSKEYQKNRLTNPGNRYALIGNKLSHSVSPQIHNLFFQKAKLNGVYELFEVEQTNLPGLLSKLKNYGYCGANVTIPYKTDIINHLDNISDIAKRIGAVNTITLKDEIKGYNTDYVGFGRALEYCGFNPRNKSCAVLGSGGASRAVVSYLEDHGASDIVIVSRDPEGILMKYPGLRGIALESFSADGVDIIINTTPVGMYPASDSSPLSKSQIKGATFVLDLIYNPEETLLLKYARENNIPCDNGLFMLVAQAVSAQEIWQGKSYDQDIIREIYAELRQKGS